MHNAQQGQAFAPQDKWHLFLLSFVDPLLRICFWVGQSTKAANALRWISERIVLQGRSSAALVLR